jgi:hypothetical protein
MRGIARRMAAVAELESQKPGWRGAWGWRMRMRRIAAQRAWRGAGRRWEHRAKRMAQAMMEARTAERGAPTEAV